MDLISIIKYLDDPRREQGRIHSLESIMYISIAAVIGGAESWNEVEEFGHLKEDFFASRIKGFSGVPSHDTFNRVFSLLDPMQLERCFRSSGWNIQAPAMYASRSLRPLRETKSF
ncbi:MAG: transposase family protein [Bacteroidaceae bacterium]|nr:transposase family protein [Bacteroidaceae bacterium]